VADWTVIITSLGSVSIGGGIGLLSARLSGRVALRGVEAENERRREQHQEEHFRHRQGVYHDFLNVERALSPWSVLSNAVTTEDMPALFSRLNESYNAVTLFGTDPVIESARDLLDVYARMSERAQMLFEGDPAERLSIAMDDMRDEVEKARQGLIQAMRDDVGHGRAGKPL